MSSTALAPRGLGLLAVLILAGCGAGDPPVVPPSSPETPPAPEPAPEPEPAPSPPHGAHVWVESVPGQRGAYAVGDSIVLYSRQDRETRVEGTPSLEIEVGETVRFASFEPWPADWNWPPERLQFRHRFVYEVQAEDQDEDGISIAADAFDFMEGVFLNAADTEVEVMITKVTPTETAAAVEPGQDLGTHPVVGTPPPRVCSDERELALAFGAVLVEEWDGRPLKFVFDEHAADLVPSEDIDAVFEIVRELGVEIEAQLGYPIIEVAGWTTCTGWDSGSACSGRQRGQAVATVEKAGIRATDYISGFANPRHAVMFWSNGAIRAAGDPHQWAAPHELFHLWGFTHNAQSGHAKTYPPTPGEGVEMSVTLTDWTRSRETWPTWDDIDALRCVFPKSGE